MNFSKKGMTLSQLAPLFILVLVSIIVLSIGSEIVDEVRQDECPGNSTFNLTAYGCYFTNGTGARVVSTGQGFGYVYNISMEGLEGTEEVGNWFPTVGLVLGASAVIGIVYLLMKR